jgi:prepilin-type N-terminal cleavage/methylation domain-containing protein
MPNNLGSHSRGFTFVEILVSVIVLAVVVAVAIPNLMTYRAKAKQNEAKVSLTQIYSAEKLFYEEHKSYTYCLYQAGYKPDEKAERYYLTGFFNDGGDGCGIGTCWISNFEKQTPCSPGSVPWGEDASRNDGTFSMNRWANADLKGAGIPGEYSVSRQRFNAVAFGSIHATSQNFDVWEIDEKGVAKNVQTGL